MILYLGNSPSFIIRSEIIAGETQVFIEVEALLAAVIFEKEKCLPLRLKYWASKEESRGVQCSSHICSVNVRPNLTLGLVLPPG